MIISDENNFVRLSSVVLNGETMCKYSGVDIHELNTCRLVWGAVTILPFHQ